MAKIRKKYACDRAKRIKFNRISWRRCWFVSYLLYHYYGSGFYFFTDAADLSLVDLVIGVGGDGTLLHINSLFPKKVPLVIAFNLGSLGFVIIIFRNAIHRTSN